MRIFGDRIELSPHKILDRCRGGAKAEAKCAQPSVGFYIGMSATEASIN